MVCVFLTTHIQTFTNFNYIAVGPFTQWNQLGVNKAKQQGVPVLVTEYNRISCGGTNVSDTVRLSLSTLI